MQYITALFLPPITVEITDYENSNPLILIDSGFRPYLRPMSSMTEEEREEFESIRYNYAIKDIKFKLKHKDNHLSYSADIFTTDWLNSHHFDYRCLIEKGLALEAKEGMYKIK